MTEQPTTEKHAAEAPTTDAPIVRKDLDALSRVKVAGELDLLTAAKAFAASGMFPDVRTQSQAIVKIVAGYELGVPPFAAMQGFHAIPRKKKVRTDQGEKWIEEIEISMSANLRAAIIRRDPNIDLRIVEHTNEVCEVEVAVRFAGEWEKRGSVRYTIDEARKVNVPAGSGQTRPLADGNMWKNYPADMLFAAVMRRVSKRYAPHLFIGDQPGAAEDDFIAATGDVETQVETQAEDVVDGEFAEESGPDGAGNTRTGAYPPAPSSPDTHEKGEGDEGAAPASEAEGDAGRNPGPDARDGGDGQDVARTEAQTAPEPEPADEGSEGEPGTAPSDPPVPATDVMELHGLTVHRIGGEPAKNPMERCTADQWQAIHRIALKGELGPEQVQEIFEFRHGSKALDATRATAEEFGSYLKEEIKRLAKAARR